MLGTKDWKKAYSCLKLKPNVVKGVKIGYFQYFFVKSSEVNDRDFELNKKYITRYQKRMAKLL